MFSPPLAEVNRNHQPKVARSLKKLAILPSKKDTVSRFLRLDSLESKDEQAPCNVILPDDESCLVTMVKALLKANPKAAKSDSEGGRLPLHMACNGRACLGVIKVILAAYPSAARHRTRDGDLPLHLVANCGLCTPEVAVCLLQAYPDAAYGRNRHERTPLEEALYVGGEVGRDHQAELIRILRKHPSYWNKPAVQLSLPKLLTHVRQLTDSTASLSEVSDIAEDLADETSDTSTSCCELDDPVCVLASSAELTILIRSKSWLAVIKRIELFPEESKEMLNVASRSGRTMRFSPLHYVMEHSPSFEAVEAIVEANSDSLSLASTPGKQLPIHVACAWGAAHKVVVYILEGCPDGSHARDEVGNLPLHLACYSGSSKEVIETLIYTNRKSVWVTNGTGSTPIDIVKRLQHKNKKEIIHLLDLHMDLNLITGSCAPGTIKEEMSNIQTNSGDLQWI